MNNILVIAEVGINHNGDFKLAHKYIDECKKIGVDIVKFQIAIPENVVLENAKKAKYQKSNSLDRESQLDMIKKLHLSTSEYIKLIDYSHKNKVNIMFSAFDNDSLDLILRSSILNYIKIPSGEITNKPYLMKIAKSKKKIILSTGMATMKEIEAAVNILKKNKLTLMHCTSRYPTPFNDVNLNLIDTLKRNFKLPVGYSDHTIGFEVPIAAVAKGASIIEKHITFNVNGRGPDHKASMSFKDFTIMVKCIRNIEKSLGNKIKKISNFEKENQYIVRKSIFASKEIKKGEILTYENICIKRPGTGLSPMLIDKFIGKKSKFNFKKNESIK